MGGERLRHGCLAASTPRALSCPAKPFPPCRFVRPGGEIFDAFPVGPSSSACFRPSTPSSNSGAASCRRLSRSLAALHNRLASGELLRVYTADPPSGCFLRWRTPTHEALRPNRRDLRRCPRPWAVGVIVPRLILQNASRSAPTGLRREAWAGARACERGGSREGRAARAL